MLLRNHEIMSEIFEMRKFLAAVTFRTRARLSTYCQLIGPIVLEHVHLGMSSIVRNTAFIPSG